MGRLLDWLELFDGESYHERWHASGADGQGDRWTDAIGASVPERAKLLCAVDGLICAAALRPSYPWLLAGRRARLWAMWREHHDAPLFARIATAADDAGLRPMQRSRCLIDFARISIRTGRTLSQLGAADLLEYRTAVLAQKGKDTSVSWASTYYLGRQTGLFADGPAEFNALMTLGQRSAAQIVDYYQVQSPTMRRLLTAYLAERRPSLDYNSFTGMARLLCRTFWRDIELHNPGIDTHRLSRAQIEDWKKRVAVLPKTDTPRKRLGEAFLMVRCFYLDLNHWAHDEPQRWAQFAAPSPITRHDVRSMPGQRRVQLARKHAHVRTLVPQLPTLVASALAHRDHCAAVLAGAQAVRRGERFTAAERTYTRLAGDNSRLSVNVQDEQGRIFDAVFAEHEAFWSWAVIEILRHLGIRIEELLELTHHSIRPYRQPDGKVIPLIQIAPSKTDAERVIPASPQVASALARVIARIASSDGTIPLTIRHDEHERCWSDPLPHLLQYRLAGRPRTFTSGTIREYLIRALKRAGMPIAPGERLTPHDFRRLFTTEAVNGGLPVHIAAALLGHTDLNVTLGYTAIYPEEVISRYQQFLQRRRELRPTGEYRTPTAGELAQFAQHFGRRRIELGTCVRPYGAPCVHEHACLRCPFQQIDPDQLGRLREIEADVASRLAQARASQWLGDVGQLEQTLRHITGKRTTVEQLLAEPPITISATRPATLSPLPGR